MSRGFNINGIAMVSVIGNSQATGIASLAQLGLSEDQIQVTYDVRHMEIQVNGWGSEIPADLQNKLAAVNIRMTLVHYDPAVLDACLSEAIGGALSQGIPTGQMPTAGMLMGGGVAVGTYPNHFIRLCIYSPIQNKPYRFLAAYLTGNPLVLPLGVDRSQATMTWRALPYAPDPWGGGLGSYGVPLWDNAAPA